MTGGETKRRKCEHEDTVELATAVISGDLIKAFETVTLNSEPTVSAPECS